MGEDFLLSVIVPIYNVAPYLRKCMDGILHQTYQNLEIILVVDGGCSDNSAEICEEYAAKDSRIKVLNRPHEEVTSARKAGVECASGAYVAWVDGDDWIESDAYEKLTALIKKTLPDVLIYGFREECRESTFLRLCGIPAGYYDMAEIRQKVYPKLLERRYIPQIDASPLSAEGQSPCDSCQTTIYACLWSKIVKRELIRKTQMMVPDDVTIGEDLICSIYTLLSAHSVVITDEAPYHYQVRDDSASMSNRSFEPFQHMFAAAYQALQSSPMRNLHINQLYRRTLDDVLITHYDAFLQGEFSCFPFGELGDCRVALYGAGKFGQEIYRKTKAVFPDRIACWVDQNYKAYQEIGLPIEPLNMLLEREYDVIVLALVNEKLCGRIKENLMAMGIAPEKIRYAEASPELLDAVKEILNRSVGE